MLGVRDIKLARDLTVNLGPTMQPLNCSLSASELPFRDHKNVSEKVPSRSDCSWTLIVFTSPISRVPSRGRKLNLDA